MDVEMDADVDSQTGNPDVDVVLERVAAVGEHPLDVHVEVFEDAHRRLRAVLDAG